MAFNVGQIKQVGKHQQEQKPKLGAQEKSALKKMQAEAKLKGSVLENNGEGGLPPSLVLGVMRRDGFRCKVCGKLGTKDDGISVHHKGHVENPESKWLEKKGKSNDPNNIVTVHAGCHDAIHNKDRAEGEEK